MEIGTAAWRELIRSGSACFGVDLDAKASEQFSFVAKELALWNRKINLTSITDPKAVAEKHFVDSLAARSYLPRHAKVLDLGTGAGFPGIPLSVVSPDLTMALIDASAKKISFVKHIIRILGLKNARAEHLRAEALARCLTRNDKFDVVLCRAFSTLDHILQLSIPLLNKGGMVLALKGSLPLDEIQACGGTGAASQRIIWDDIPIELNAYTYQLPFSKDQRSLIQMALL